MGKEQFKAERIDTSFEITLENLQGYLAEVASVVRDKDPKSAAKLWDRLMVESYGKLPSSTFSFIPCTLSKDTSNEIVIKWEQYTDSSTFRFFGTFDNVNGKYYTNMRELLQIGFTVDEIIPTVDFTHYQAFKCMTMYKVYQQLRTHTQMNFISHSQRYTQSTHGFWYPPEFANRHVKLTDPKHAWNERVLNSTPAELEIYMKDELKIPRREIYALGKDMLELRVFSVGGYTNTQESFQHFINQRSKDAHTQLETREMLDVVMENMMGE